MMAFLILFKNHSPFITIQNVLLISLLISIATTLNQKEDFNIIHDYIIPINLICSAWAFIFVLEISILEKLLFILLINKIIITPFLKYYSKKKNWQKTLSSFQITSQIYLRIINALYYPLIWVVLLLLLRYIRLGNSIDISNMFSNNIIIMLIITLFLWPFTVVWINFIIIIFLNIKNKLFNLFFEFIFDIHLTLLKYHLYFNFSKKIHKISFIFWMFIIHHPGIYTKFPPNKIRKFIKVVSIKPYIAYIIPFISIFLELIINKGTLYYSFYIFLIFLIIKLCFQMLATFAKSHWAYTCNLSDYLNINWENPKYPKSFWLSFNTLRLQFKTKPEISDLLENEIQNYINIIELLDKKERNRKFKLQKKIRYTNYFNIKNRHKIVYYQWSQVRWTHTERLLNATVNTLTKYHPLTSLYAKNATDYAVLINNNWSHFHVIEKFKLKINYKAEIKYINYDTPNFYKINKIMEHNLLTNFQTLKKRQIMVSSYEPKVLLDTSNQSRDDVIINTKTAEPPLLDCRIHGLDQKASVNIREASSKILSQVSKHQYNNIINDFQNLLFQNNTFDEVTYYNIIEALERLKNTCDNLQMHQITWAEIVYLFPNNYIPPMRVPYNFCIEDLTNDVLINLQRSLLRMQKISDLLYQYEAPNDLKRGAELFEDSYIQNLFKEKIDEIYNEDFQNEIIVTIL